MIVTAAAAVAVEREEEETCSISGIGFTMGKAGCGKELYVRVVHENDGPGNIVSKRVFSQEQTLNECLTRDPTLCREKDSLTAAKKLPSERFKEAPESWFVAAPREREEIQHLRDRR